MRRSLAGRVVLITGAARGIGAATARLAAARGARVALLGLEPERLAAVAAELGPGHRWFEADVTDQAAVERAVAGTVAELGGLDVVVANAGIAPYGTVASGPVDALVRTLDVNLVGVLRAVHAALPHVSVRRGYVLVVSSAAAFTALPGMAAYCASKAGVEQLANVLRLEVAHLGVAVGTAYPSWIDTDLVRDLDGDLGGVAEALSRAPGPLGTVTSVQACAEALVEAMQRRRRRVYVPRSVGIVQALRPLVLGRLGELAVRRGARRSVPELERHVRSQGRWFGRHSVEG